MLEKIPETINYADIDFSNPLVLRNLPFRFRRIPVIVTIADSQITEVDVQKMLEAGMNVAKLKLSSSSKGDKIRLLAKIEKAVSACSTKYGVTHWPIATCIELKTRIVKTGLLDGDKDCVPLVKDSYVILSYNIKYFNKCSAEIIFVDNHFLLTDVKAGTEISIAADEIILICIETADEESIKCLVKKGGMLTSLSNVCTRHIKYSRPLVTQKDIDIIKFALEYQFDTIVINYVRHPDTLRKIKHFIKTQNTRRPFIMCGICTEEGLENIDGIIKESDGLILSREYLPYEMEASKQSRMPQIQKWIAGKCLQAGKPFYISGGVFENALKSGNFIDCEISDVTNALIDGASGLILEDCRDTAFTIEVIKGINELCYTFEPLLISKTNFNNVVEKIQVPVNAAEATIISCVTIANQTNARVIVVPTVSGKTIKYLHWIRPSCIIITVSTDIRVTRLLRVYRSIMPLIYLEQHNKWNKNITARINFAIEYAVTRSWLEYGDTYVTLQRGSESSSFCDTVRICKVPISKKQLAECADDENETSKLQIF